MAQFRLEYTDTSRVRRAEISVPDAGFYADAASDRRMIMRAAKAALGLTGVPGRTAEHGDSYEFRPYGQQAVLVVSW